MRVEAKIEKVENEPLGIEFEQAQDGDYLLVRGIEAVSAVGRC